MASTDDAELQVHVPWARLQAWIDDKVAYERMHNGPAPLSRPELEAVSKLVPIPGEQEAELDDEDYISLLMKWTQARYLLPPEYHDIGPVNVPVCGTILPKWRNVCDLPGHGSFPRLGHGIDGTGQQAPVFHSKKKAKQYAAKCALQYIKQLSRPTLGSGMKEAKSLGKTRRCQTPPKSHPASASHAVRGESLHPDADSSDSDEESSSTLRCADELAVQVGLGSLHYKIEPDGDLRGLFRGRPVFQYPNSVPPDLGVVSGVLGKKQTRIQIAESILPWLIQRK